MTRFNPLELLLDIEAAGSLSAVAVNTGCTVSAVSKMLSNLEAQLGRALVDRQARPLRLTDAGIAYLEAARSIRQALSLTHDKLAQATQKPAGRLRLTTSVLFGHSVLPTYLDHFQQRYPDVRLEVSLSDDYVDLAREDYDLAIRHEQRGGTAWISRPLCDNRAWLCASPAYIARQGMPADPAALSQHQLLVYRYSGLDTRWIFRRDGNDTVLAPHGMQESNSNDLLISLALSGSGLLPCPIWSVIQPLRDGRLVRCLPEWEFHSDSYGDDQLWAVYPHSSRGSLKLRSFVDGLRDWLGDHLRLD